MLLTGISSTKNDTAHARFEFERNTHSHRRPHHSYQQVVQILKQNQIDGISQGTD